MPQNHKNIMDFLIICFNLIMSLASSITELVFITYKIMSCNFEGKKMKENKQKRKKKNKSNYVKFQEIVKMNIYVVNLIK